MAWSAMNPGLALLFSLLFVGCCRSAANVVLIGTNVTLSFDSIEANFAPSIKSSGEPGVLYVAKPLDACSALTNKVELSVNSSSPFALMIRGGCSFEDKVRRAQVAGFKAAIIYDNEDGGALIAMAGSSAGIRIHAVFVTKESGETLKKYAGMANTEIWIVPSFENSAWSIMAISFISLLAMSAVLATCFFVRRHRIRRERPRSSHLQEFRGMSRRVVKAMPSLIFTTALEDNCTSITCAICLEDYTAGEKLRILPCRHKFHAICVDSWLTAWRTFCPVCKRDARTSWGKTRSKRMPAAKGRGRRSKQPPEPMKVLPKGKESPAKPLPMASAPALMLKRGIYCARSRVKLLKRTRSCRTVGLATETRFLLLSLLS